MCTCVFVRVWIQEKTESGRYPEFMNMGKM